MNEVMCLAVVITHMDDSQTWNWFKTMSTANKFIKKQNLWAVKRLLVFVDTQIEEKIKVTRKETASSSLSDDRDDELSNAAAEFEAREIYGDAQ